MRLGGLDVGVTAVPIDRSWRSRAMVHERRSVLAMTATTSFAISQQVHDALADYPGCNIWAERMEQREGSN